MTFLLTMIAIGIWTLIFQLARRPTALDALAAADDAADDANWRALSPQEREANIRVRAECGR
jgi:hypothetical protein